VQCSYCFTVLGQQWNTTFTWYKTYFFCSYSILQQPCKAILLFGFPGTAKTVLRKAVPTQVAIKFTNISMWTISLKVLINWRRLCFFWAVWVSALYHLDALFSVSWGKRKSFVKVVFSLPSKIAPSVVFVHKVSYCTAVIHNHFLFISAVPGHDIHSLLSIPYWCILSCSFIMSSWLNIFRTCVSLMLIVQLGTFFKRRIRFVLTFSVSPAVCSRWLS
jgi:hypothetical protein